MAVSFAKNIDGSVQPQAPLGEPSWPPKRLQLFRQWTTDGFTA